MTIIWYWFLRYWVQQRKVFVILDHFLPFYCPNNPKNQNFEKLKKNKSGDIIILHNCTKNHHHMLYCSFDMACNGCNCYFLHFWAIFCPFTSLTPRKIKIKKKWKKSLQISSFYNSVPKIMIICYTVPEIWCVTCNYFSFWTICCPFTPFNSPKNQNEKKKWKKHLEISSFYASVPKIMIICYTVLEIWCITDKIVLFHFGLFFALLPP